jgi:hypothetical protein
MTHLDALTKLEKFIIEDENLPNKKLDLTDNVSEIIVVSAHQYYKYVLVLRDIFIPVPLFNPKIQFKIGDFEISDNNIKFWYQSNKYETTFSLEVHI